MAHATQSPEQTTLEPSTTPLLDDRQASPPGVSGPRSATSWWPRRNWYVLMDLLIVSMAAMSPYAWHLWHYYHTHESTDNAYVVGDVIPISSRVPGVVQTVAVETHQSVEAGQLLARLDPRDFTTRVRQAEAAVAEPEGSSPTASKLAGRQRLESPSGRSGFASMTRGLRQAGLARRPLSRSGRKYPINSSDSSSLKPTVVWR